MEVLVTEQALGQRPQIPDGMTPLALINDLLNTFQVNQVFICFTRSGGSDFLFGIEFKHSFWCCTGNSTMEHSPLTKAIKAEVFILT